MEVKIAEPKMVIKQGYLTVSTDHIEEHTVDSPAYYAFTKFTVPAINVHKWGLSWLVLYEEPYGSAIENKHYPSGDSDRYPNTLVKVYFVDPRDGYVFNPTPTTYYFESDMVKVVGGRLVPNPQVNYYRPDISRPLLGVPELVDVYVQFGTQSKNIYTNRSEATVYDSDHYPIKTNYYVDSDYCRIAYEEVCFEEHEGYPYRLDDDMPDETPVLFETGSPDMIWRIDSSTGMISSPLIVDNEIRLFEFDCPDMLWRTDGFTNNGMIYSPLIPGMVLSGAFKDVISLEQITIPRSCQRIGPVAFAGTSLRKVMISAECEYSETSFPEGCEVEFYEGGGEYAQLYDCNGFAIIDCNRARIYIT